MGPTASGKTALALALHSVLPVEIVSVDASQVYRGMDIGTAKPTPAEQARATHRLIDIRDPAEAYSAAEFCVDARREIDQIIRRGHIPLLVGGTMFYFHALEFGLSALPPADPTVRGQFAEAAARSGWPALHSRLAAVDPQAAARIKPNDGQRIQRALEIYAITGRSASELNKSARRQTCPYGLVKVALFPKDRASLHERIARRFESMLEQGLVGEVERLYKRGDLSAGLPSIRTVGYRQVWQYLTETIKYYEMKNRATAATRQLAKRQLTWLRSYPGVKMFDICNVGLADSVLKYLGATTQRTTLWV